MKLKYENITTQVEEESSDAPKFQISSKKWNIMKKLSYVVCLSFLFMVGEALGGYFANSLAVMSDAAHLFSDVCGYALSLVAVYLSTLPKSKSMPFGYIRAEILGALCSVLMLWVVLVHLVQEGMERLSNPEVINGRLMFIISTCGLGVNLLMGFILVRSGHSHSHGLRKCNHSINDDMETPLSPSARGVVSCDCHAKNFDFGLSMNSGKHTCTPCEYSTDQTGVEHSACSDECDLDNMNIRAAYVHVVADTMQSFGVVLSSALIWYNPERFAIVDPICTLIFAALGFACSMHITKDIISIFMLQTPNSVDLDSLQTQIENLDARILQVEDLRVWALTANESVLTCRICTRSDALSKPTFYDQVKRVAKEHGILDATVQVENIAVKRNFMLIDRKFT